MSIFNIYCDESCHLENDDFSAMVLGAVWCPDSHHKYLARKVKQLKKSLRSLQIMKLNGRKFLKANSHFIKHS